MRKLRTCLAGLVSFGIVLPGPAMADDRLIGGLIGLGAAAIILHQNAKQQREEQIRQRQPRVVSEEEIKRKALRAEIQRRLNALGFDAGTPDGVYGRRTRTAIAAFQRSLGNPASGTITETEVATLYGRSAGLATDGSGFAAYTQGGEAGAFPVLGAPGSGQPAPGAFPTLGQPPAGAPGPVMPGLAAAPVPVPQQMPGIGAGAPQPDPAGDVASLTAELTRTPYKTAAAQPSVAGVMLGHSAEAAIALLAGEGFADCDPAAAPVACSRKTELLSDEVVLWEDTGKASWAIVRSISFNTPVPADMVLNQFRTSYPELMGTPARMISSGQYCHAAQLSAADLRLTVESIAATYGNVEGPVPAAVGDFAERCPVVFAVKLEGGEMVTAATIAFVDATGVTRMIASQQMKLTNDLKL